MKLRLMLDTVVLARICHPTDFRDVQQWFRELLESGSSAPDLLISALADYELRKVLQGKHAIDGLQRLETLAKHLQYVPVNAKVVRRAAELRQVVPAEQLSDADLLIAAQALTEGAVMVTSDKRFRQIPGLSVKDWNEIDFAMARDTQEPAASDTKPKGPRTGFASPHCYAAALNDCGGDPVTQEHYISKSLLTRFGQKFFVGGLPWIPVGGARELTGSTLTAGILCRRHNNVLSPLDRTIGRFYDVLSALHHGHGDVGLQVFHGEDLERWSLKLLLGLMAAGLQIDGRLERISSPPLGWLQVLFGEAKMPELCGFYIHRRSDRGIRR